MPALYSHTTRATGTILTATVYNSDHQNHIDNGIPAQLDDYSSNATQMQTETDPGESGSESLATSLAGELERLRFSISELKTRLGHSTGLWYATPTFDYLQKNNDESIGSTTLQDDDALLFSVGTSGVYEFEFSLMFTTANDSDLKWAITFPGAATMRLGWLCHENGGTPACGSAVSYTSGTAITFDVTTGGGAEVLGVLRVKGTIAMGGSGGTVQFQFAKNAAGAVSATMRRGSFGFWRKIT